MSTSAKFWTLGAFRLLPVEDVEHIEDTIDNYTGQIYRLEKNVERAVRDCRRFRRRCRELEALCAEHGIITPPIKRGD